jgi:choice-of-anchor B domain-containing protein
MRYITLACLLICTTLQLNAQFNMTLLGHLPYPANTCAGVWHYVDSLNNEYAIVGVNDRLAIVDVTNPANLSEVFSVPALPGQSSLWREVKTYGKYAYAVSEGGGGLVIVDLSNLPASINHKHWYGDGAIANQITSAHTIAVTDGYAYIFGTGNGLANGGAIICDLSDPWNPVYVGQYNLNYVHDGYIRNDTLWAGEIYAGQFSVIDVTNKSNPVLLATQQTPGQFCHNTWLSDNSKYLFTTDEITGEPLGSFDITDLSNIKLLTEYYTDSMPQEEVHNVRVLNDFLINPSYGSQMVICDAARPDNIIEIAQYPTGNFLCWDASPYLPSGNIVVADVDGGVYVFSTNYTRACYLEGDVTDSITGLPVNNVQITIQPTGKTAKSDLSGVFKTGTALPGTYDIEFKKAGYVTKVLTGIQLVNGQLTTLSVQLAPFALNGVAVNAQTSQLLEGVAVVLSDGINSVTLVSDVSGNFSTSTLASGTITYQASKWGFVTQCGQQTLTPGTPFTVSLVPGYYDDFVTDNGWTVNSTATGGLWERGIPNATLVGGVPANPGNDVSGDCGDFAYVTGNAVGSNPALDDLDNGATVLTSPLMDLSNYSNPWINYERWLFIQPGIPQTSLDTLFIYISDGINTSLVEALSYFNAPNGIWQSVSIPLNGIITPGPGFQVIVSIADQPASGNLLEAGFDKFSITNGPANVDELIDRNKTVVFPNPSSGSFSLKFPANLFDQQVQVRMLDIMGRLIYQDFYQAGENVIEPDVHLKPGVYMLSLWTDNEMVDNIKLVVR